MKLTLLMEIVGRNNQAHFIEVKTKNPGLPPEFLVLQVIDLS